MPHRQKICEGCGKEGQLRKGTIRCGHFLCGHCKIRTHFEILGKHNQPIQSNPNRLRPQSSRVSLLRDESRFLWIKHIKQCGNEKQAAEALHQVRFFTKMSHISNRTKSDGSARFKLPDKR